MKYQGVILVGGKGSRLKELTKKTAKPLLQIGSKPFLDYLLYYICKYNFKIIFLLCSYKHKDFFHRYHNKEIFGVKIKCILEKKPKGTGGALFNIKKYITNDFFLFNGDSFFPIDLDNFYNFSKDSNKIISIACTKNKNYKSNKKINNISIKKNLINFSKNKTYIMNGGVYYIKRKFLRSINNNFSSLENEHFKNLINQNQIFGKIYNKFFIDIGIKKNLKTAIKFLKLNISNKAFFLDRDGVINEDTGYVYKKNDFFFKPGVFKAINIINKKKYLTIVVTNQSGIGRGYYSKKSFNKITNFILKECNKNNANIDDTYYCPHHPTKAKGKYKKNCNCRKPKPGLIQKAISDWSIDVKNSYMIGDKKTDKMAAKKCNITFFYKKNIKFDKQITHIIKKNK
tara:strand:+ start:108 stop:1304 length:1197 start_codon:yes stop_codon:yes gene_type:complete